MQARSLESDFDMDSDKVFKTKYSLSLPSPIEPDHVRTMVEIAGPTWRNRMPIDSDCILDGYIEQQHGKRIHSGLNTLRETITEIGSMAFYDGHYLWPGRYRFREIKPEQAIKLTLKN